MCSTTILQCQESVILFKNNYITLQEIRKTKTKTKTNPKNKSSQHGNSRTLCLYVCWLMLLSVTQIQRETAILRFLHLYHLFLITSFGCVCLTFVFSVVKECTIFL